MSTVLTLLILAFLLWPLLQKLLRATQQVTEPETAQPEGTSASELLKPESELRPTMEYVPLPAAMTTADLAPLRNAMKTSAPLIPRGGRNSTFVAKDRRTIHPRQAMVFMTVIGPCRAASPYDSSGGGAS